MRTSLFITLAAGLLTCSFVQAQTAIAGRNYLIPQFKPGETFGTIFSRTVTITSNDFQPMVSRISGTGNYTVTTVTDSLTSFDADFLYDGRPEDHSPSGIADSGKTLVYNGKSSPNTDASGLAYNPLLWGPVPSKLKAGDSWETAITQPWELGGVGREKVTVVTADPANFMVTLKREGDGDGAFLYDQTEMDIAKDGKKIHVKITPGKNHWVGYTVIRQGIVISDELLMTRPLTLTAEGVTISANQRQYILLNQMAG